MIIVVGTTRRSFLFPADLAAAYSYYSDPQHVFKHLPYISVTRDYGHNRFQVVYDQMELITYRIRIFANVEFVRDEVGQVLSVRPFEGGERVKARAELNASAAMGIFSSRSVFYQENDQTRIEYSLQLEAALPTPLDLLFMPGSMVNTIAERITHSRIREIAAGFIDRSIEAFPRHSMTT